MNLSAIWGKTPQYNQTIQVYLSFSNKCNYHFRLKQMGNGKREIVFEKNVFQIHQMLQYFKFAEMSQSNTNTNIQFYLWSHTYKYKTRVFKYKYKYTNKVTYLIIRKVQRRSSWPNDAIWRQISRSTLDKVMACCLTAPSHYLKQCWFITSKVHWHSFQYNFTRDTSAINH